MGLALAHMPTVFFALQPKENADSFKCSPGATLDSGTAGTVFGKVGSDFRKPLDSLAFPFRTSSFSVAFM